MYKMSPNKVNVVETDMAFVRVFWPNLQVYSNFAGCKGKRHETKKARFNTRCQQHLKM